MNPLKRNHSQSGGNEGITLTNQPFKRPCSSAEDTSSKSDTVSQVYMDALRDISDEIRFAVKCIDRAAGDETIKMTLANISRLATTAIEKGVSIQIAPTGVETPNKVHTDSQLTPTSTIPAATFPQYAAQTRPSASPGLNQVTPSTSTVRFPSSSQPTKPPPSQPPKPAVIPTVPKGFTPAPVDTITPLKPGGATPNGPQSTQNSTYSFAIPNGPSQFKRPPPRSPSSTDILSRSRNDPTSRSPEGIRNIGATPPTEPSKSPSTGYDSFRQTENTRPPESPRRDPPQNSQRPQNPPSMTVERVSRWDLKDNPTTFKRDPPKSTEATLKSSFPNNSNQNSNFPHVPPPSGPRNSLISKNVAPIDAGPTGPHPSSTLSEKLSARLSLESTLKITAGKNQSFHQINLLSLLTALKLPNLLRLEIRNSTLYLRLLDSFAAHRIACNYKNFKLDTPPEHQRVLTSIKLFSPSDYAPAVSVETMNAWHSGARRMLVTNSFAPERRRSQGEYDEFVAVIKRLGGYFSLSRNGGGKVWIGFEGVESCVAGKAILERRFNDIHLQYSEELARGDL